LTDTNTQNFAKRQCVFIPKKTGIFTCPVPGKVVLLCDIKNLKPFFMKLKTTSFLKFVALLILMISFEQCRTKNDGKIPISSRDSVMAHIIPVETGAAFTKNFRSGLQELKRQIKDSGFLDNSFSMPNAEQFNRDAVAALLNAPGAKGIRIYLGRDEKGLIRMVLVPTDAKNNDIITTLLTSEEVMIPGISSANALPPETGEVIESGQRCPTLCAGTSPLN
jgi:hypothetical protein